MQCYWSVLAPDLAKICKCDQLIRFKIDGSTIRTHLTFAINWFLPYNVSCQSRNCTGKLHPKWYCFRKGVSTNIHWVVGHANLAQNELADKAAKSAADSQQCRIPCLSTLKVLTWRNTRRSGRGNGIDQPPSSMSCFRPYQNRDTNLYTIAMQNPSW